MLPRRHRITNSTDFSLVTRSGRKTRRGCLLVYTKAPVSMRPIGSGKPMEDRTARVGLIVSRGVGNSVVRHRVSRVIRHQMSERVSAFRPGTMLVVRALPGAGSEPNAGIARDLKLCLESIPGELLESGPDGMPDSGTGGSDG